MMFSSKYYAILLCKPAYTWWHRVLLRLEYLEWKLINWGSSALIGLKERVFEVLEKYGDKAYLLLKTIVEVTREYAYQGRNRYGDFDYRGLVLKLKASGLDYNPSSLLRILEEEYGLIETSYRSSNQHWWKIISLQELDRALKEYEGLDEGLDDPEVLLIKLQVQSLDLQGIKRILEKMLKKNRLSEIDKKRFRRIVFEDLELLVKVLKRALEYEDYLEEEINLMREVLMLAFLIAKKIGQPAVARSLEVIKAIAVEPKP